MRELPVLFNTEMVQAIIEGRKTNTRRIIKPQPVYETGYVGQVQKQNGVITHIYGSITMQELTNRCQYKPGDTLWVRETWAYKQWSNKKIYYRADGELGDVNRENGKWKPSIHMPREAARLFLIVKGVHVERLQDITEDGAKAEGIKLLSHDGKTIFTKDYRNAFKTLWDSIYAAPAPVKRHGVITHYESYPWEELQEVRKYKGLPWYVYANPFVWSIEFERKV